MEKQIFPFLFLILYFSMSAQNAGPAYPDFMGKELRFVEQNPEWKVLQTSTGDLNEDGLEDMALILESKDSLTEIRCSSCYPEKKKPRIILILLDQNAEQRVVVQNNRFIARGDEGGMLSYFEPELSIHEGLLKIFYQYTRSNQSYTFQYKNMQMEIVAAESVSVHSASGNVQRDKYDFIEGTLSSASGHISEEDLETRISKIDVQRKTLSDFKEMYEWEVTANKSL